MTTEAWKSGYPDKRGIYRVRIDGEEGKLIHSMCTLTDKHRWMTLTGHDIVGHTIEWKGDQLNVDQL